MSDETRLERLPPARLRMDRMREADLTPITIEQTDRVHAMLDGVGRLGVAFSGGVDSAVLLALAVRALGQERVLAVVGVSASLAVAELEAARAVAHFIGAQLVEVATAEGDRPAYRLNGPDRCFHCKDELFTRIDEEVADRYRLDAVAYGENADDALRPDRPGAQAATAHRVLRPLADAGLTKADVRAIARDLELPCADKPAAPCLASRIPHFTQVTPAKLARVERAESAVRSFGFTDCRVRDHGVSARVELPVADLPRVESVREPLLAAVRAAGFTQATIDPRGLQSGAFTLTAMGLESRSTPTGRAG